MLQPHTSSFGELGVQGQYFDGEGHLVDHALTGRLSFRPQFQITRRIIESVSIFVMNVLFITKRTLEHFFHNKSVFINFPTSTKIDASVSRRHDVTLFRYRAPFAAFPSTFLRAKALFIAVPQLLTAFHAISAPFSDFTAEGALKHNRLFLVHADFVSLLGPRVKEIV